MNKKEGSNEHPSPSFWRQPPGQTETTVPPGQAASSSSANTGSHDAGRPPRYPVGTMLAPNIVVTAGVVTDGAAGKTSAEARYGGPGRER